MARGRFVSNTISTSKKFARLASNDHRLLYLMLLTHVDAEGRHDADPRILNGQVYTLLDLTPDQINDALQDMHAVNLIILYQVDGDRFLEITNFHEHNKVRRNDDGKPSREAPSGIPPASSGTICADTPDQLRNNSAVTPAQGLRVKSKELSVKSEGLSAKVDAAATPAPPPPASHLAAAPPRETYDPGLFMEIWNANRGRLPAITTLNRKRKGAIRALVKEHGAQAALALFRDATRAVATDDFWLERQYGFDTLTTGGKVLTRAEQWRNNTARLTTGDMRLARTAERVANAIGGLDDRPN